MDHVTLVGTEEVLRAAHVMQSAAESMLRAANLIDSANERQREFMDDWLARFQQTMEKSA